MSIDSCIVSIDSEDRMFSINLISLVFSYNIVNNNEIAVEYSYYDSRA